LTRPPSEGRLLLRPPGTGPLLDGRIVEEGRGQRHDPVLVRLAQDWAAAIWSGSRPSASRARRDFGHSSARRWPTSTASSSPCRSAGTALPRLDGAWPRVDRPRDLFERRARPHGVVQSEPPIGVRARLRRKGQRRLLRVEIWIVGGGAGAHSRRGSGRRRGPRRLTLGRRRRIGGPRGVVVLVIVTAPRSSVPSQWARRPVFCGPNKPCRRPSDSISLAGSESEGSRCRSFLRWRPFCRRGFFLACVREYT
jgi:hypothetical protein